MRWHNATHFRLVPWIFSYKDKWGWYNVPYKSYLRLCYVQISHYHKCTHHFGVKMTWRIVTPFWFDVSQMLYVTLVLKTFIMPFPLHINIHLKVIMCHNTLGEGFFSLSHDPGLASHAKQLACESSLREFVNMIFLKFIKCMMFRCKTLQLTLIFGMPIYRHNRKFTKLGTILKVNVRTLWRWSIV